MRPAPPGFLFFAFAKFHSEKICTAYKPRIARATGATANLRPARAMLSRLPERMRRNLMRTGIGTPARHRTIGSTGILRC